jgi:SAM-dependent methyltransferase
MIKILKYKGVEYPEFQAKGNAAKFAIPFAKQVCVGDGFDIGCMKKEWSFPGSTPIDLSFDDEWDAHNLPNKQVDYIFSSHCLEHIDSWVDALEHWYSRIKKGGVLFLYLPHYDQEYWRPWNNKKHRNIFSPRIIKDYLENNGYHKIYVSDKDLNYSFMVMAEKI